MTTNNGNTQAIDKTGPAQVEVRERQPTSTSPLMQQNRPVFTPTIDVRDLGEGKGWQVIADIPGADPQSIDVRCEDDVLTLYAHVPARWPTEATPRHAEYNIGDYRRTMRIGEDVDVERISAEYTSGVLTLTLPRVARAQARRILIKGV